MARYFLQLSYNGADFHGWQVQHNAHTIQSELNSALSVYLKENIATIGAGRTDTGVHASFFVAQFDSEHNNLEDNKAINLYKLNAILPKTIALHNITKMHDDANCRFDAISRTYIYYMHKGKNPFKLNFSAPIFGDVDVELMNEAAKELFRYTDFTSFSKLHSDVKTNNCLISEALWRENKDDIFFTITANRFLRNMVRAIVGTLLDVGQKRISIKDFTNIIEQKNRCKAGSSAPAKGLFLVDIKYPYNI